MKRFLGLVVASTISLCTTSIVKGDEGGLFVTFEVAGERFESEIRNPGAIQYVRSFVEGKQAPRRFCAKTKAEAGGQLEQWLVAQHENCPWPAQIVKAEECKSGQCVALRGIYAGRSPAF